MGKLVLALGQRRDRAAASPEFSSTDLESRLRICPHGRFRMPRNLGSADPISKGASLTWFPSDAAAVVPPLTLPMYADLDSKRDFTELGVVIHRRYEWEERRGKW
uniref:Uncharacterized protein n=1 Tax=Kalanchoe fedtschenkoi TaxID=63787 RepID=A0A7N0TJE3_KALFE